MKIDSEKTGIWSESATAVKV